MCMEGEEGLVWDGVPLEERGQRVSRKSTARRTLGIVAEGPALFQVMVVDGRTLLAVMVVGGLALFRVKFTTLKVTPGTFFWIQSLWAFGRL